MYKIIITSLLILLFLSACFNEPEYERIFPYESLVPFDSSALDTGDVSYECLVSLEYDDVTDSLILLEEPTNLYVSYSNTLRIMDVHNRSWLSLKLTSFENYQYTEVIDFSLEMSDGSRLYDVSHKPEVMISWFSSDSEYAGSFDGHIWGWNSSAASYDTIFVSGQFCFED